MKEIVFMKLFSSRHNRSKVAAPFRAASRRPQLETLENRCLLSAGALDPTFGNGAGYLTANAPPGGKVLLQPDGKMVVGSYDAAFALARFNSDGSLDTSFGNGGIASTPSIQGETDHAYAAALQANGDILEGGYVHKGFDTFALVRYTPNGVLDSSFGNQGTVITYLRPAGVANSEISEILIQPDGKIIAVGGTMGASSNIVLARYNADGSLDATFGTNGLVNLVDPSVSQPYVADARLQSDGKIVTVGSSILSGQGRAYEMARFNSDGSLDTTFGTSGLVRTSFGLAGKFDGISDLAIQSDGKILVVGTSNYDASGDEEWSMARYDSSGNLDPTFGSGGKLTDPITSAPTTSSIAASLALQSDGKIVVVGNTGPTLAVARYDAFGNRDSTFGTGGVFISAIGTTANNSPAIYPQAGTPNDGKIVLAGDSGSSPNSMLVARFLGDTSNSNGTATLTGSPGYGSQGFIAPGATLPYQIKFANASTATALAQAVVISDPLDPKLDWNTFQLTGLGFGANTISIPAGTQDYQTTVPMTYNGTTFNVVIQVQLNTTTGVLTVSFQSIDPATNLPPDQSTGFLPPEDGSGRGQGFVSYVIRPRTGLATGTQIHNIASVTVDSHPAFTTDQVDDGVPSKGVDPSKEALNTIDAGPPSSSVNPLLAFSPTSFTVAWSGHDDVGGSGIASYNVFVSDDGGPFTPLLTNTRQTSTTFTGQNGHDYGFFSVATDNVGNVQATPQAAQAATLVAPPQLAVSSKPLNLPAGVPAGPVTVTLEDPFGNSLPAGSGGITVTLSSSSSGATFLDASGNPISTITIPQGSSNATFVYEDTKAGAPLLTAAATGLASGTQTEQVNAGLPSAMAFTTSPQTLTAGIPSGSLTLQLFDRFGNVATAGVGGVIVYLSTTSSGGAFLDTKGNALSQNPAPLPSPSLTILQGGTTAGLEYKDSQTGAPTVMAAAWGLKSAMQQETVDPANITFPVTVANITGTAGAPFTGAVATFTVADITVTASSFSATIAWGDGMTSVVVPTGGNGSFTVSGSHSYLQEGRYQLSVIVAESNGNTGAGSALAHVGRVGSAPALSAAAYAFTHGTEYYSDFIIANYQKYLGRTPAPQEVSGWVGNMQHGMTDETAEAFFIASPEFENDYGGIGAGWISGIYQVLLNRSPIQSELNGWLQAMNDGESANAVAFAFTDSTERETDRIITDYQKYLNRNPLASEVGGWVNAFLGGLRNEDLVALFVGGAPASREYFLTHGDNTVDWLYSAYQEILGRPPDAAALQGWLGALKNG
jgi:uncharacterized delta-60 repeat protein